MDFTFDRSIIDRIRTVSSKFDQVYWREISKKKEFPSEYWEALARDSLLGLVVPNEYGGMGRSLLDLVLATSETAERYAGIGSYLFLSGCLVSTLFSKSSQSQRNEILPRLAKGEIKISLALSEETSGFESIAIQTNAVKSGSGYVLDGSKTFVNNVDRTDYLVIFARTKKVAETGGKKSIGVSMFLVPTGDKNIHCRKLEKLGWDFVNNFDLDFHDLKVPQDALVGEEDIAWHNALESFNLDRVATAASLVGTGRLVIKTASDYARGRVVFGKPVGSNQGIQFPLAEAAARLITAEAATLKAASLQGKGASFIETANFALCQAVRAASFATERALQTFGGHGYYTEYDVERYWRDVRAYKVHPISEELLLASIAERSLGLPRSY